MDKKSWVKQVKPEKGYYLAGFTDGEGNFNVSLREHKDHAMGRQVILTFSVSQKESYILSQFKRILGCGRILKRKNGLYMYVVSNPTAIVEKVIPFFKRFNFLSQTKKTNFSIFSKIAKLVYEKKHLSKKELNEILKLRKKLIK